MNAPIGNGVSAARDLTIALLALAALAGWELSALDPTLSAGYGSAQGFAARHAGWSQRLLHDGGRWLSAAVLAVVALQAWRGFAGDLQPRRERLAWLGAVLCAFALVPAAKRFSATSCPWDLSLFGGSAVYAPHWSRLLDGGPGHCFPSGHAVAAFAFLPLYFRWRAQRPHLARAVLLASLGIGALFGWAQLARGAHFASHTLWSAWLCWCVGGVVVRLIGVMPMTRAAPQN